MKKFGKQILAVLLAMILTVAAVTALATNVSAANSNDESVGFTISNDHDFDHFETTAQPSTYEPGVTYPTAPTDPLDTILPFHKRSITASVVFKDGRLGEAEMKKDSDHPYRMFAVIKNVPASSEPYCFAIKYTAFDGGQFIDGYATDGGSLYSTQGGNFYAFRVDESCDVTVEWDVYVPSYVNAYGYIAVMTKSRTPFSEDALGSGTSDPSVQPDSAESVTYPTNEIVTNPTEEPETYPTDEPEPVAYPVDSTKATIFGNTALFGSDERVAAMENIEDNTCAYTFKNMKASVQRCEFYIEAFLYGGGTMAENTVFDDNGNNFAFYVDKDCDVTVTIKTLNWIDSLVTVTGEGVRMTKSGHKYDETEPVTYPTTVPIFTTVPIEIYTSQPATEPVSYIIGDADMNSQITISDTTTIQKYLAALIRLSDIQKLAADADGDGEVTIKDGTEIQKYLAGYETNIKG